MDFALASFSDHDLERLFLTYKRNFTNYSKIKDKIIGKDAEAEYKRNRKSSIFFFVALTFIISISSLFSLFIEHINSLGALWIIWSVAFVIFLAWSIFSYRTNYRILQINQRFFSKFERVAKNHDSLEGFKTNW